MLIATVHHAPSADEGLELTTYLVRFQMRLFNDFTFFLTDPINGDLIVSSHGDPSWNARRLGTNFWDIFEPFVTVLNHAGVRRVSGDLIADASFFHGPPTGSGGAVYDVQEGESG